MTIAPESPSIPTPPRFLELEITSRCQLTCGSLCYAEAGPTKGHGTMTGADWRRVISEAAAMRVETVQLIGGEPTLHPEFTEILRHALEVGLRVQVYSNLYRVRAEWWELFADARVSLATSYHSDDPAEHDAITGRTGSHEATRANIVEAIRRRIPVKVGVIHIHEGQRSQQARAEMEALGVGRVTVNQVRGVGNAAQTAALPSTKQLCGRCADGIAAVLPDGTVTPCTLGRFLPAGTVQGASLEGVFASPQWAQVAATIPRKAPTACQPDDCEPAASDSCGPKGGSSCGPVSNSPVACSPGDSACQPGQPACLPKYP